MALGTADGIEQTENKGAEFKAAIVDPLTKDRPVNGPTQQLLTQIERGVDSGDTASILEAMRQAKNLADRAGVESDAVPADQAVDTDLISKVGTYGLNQAGQSAEGVEGANEEIAKRNLQRGTAAEIATAARTLLAEEKAEEAGGTVAIRGEEDQPTSTADSRQVLAA